MRAKVIAALVLLVTVCHADKKATSDADEVIHVCCWIGRKNGASTLVVWADVG